MTNVSGVNDVQQQAQPVKLKIKKGQTLTKALFELAKDMEKSGGKVDAKEWSATIDKIAELQNARI